MLSCIEHRKVRASAIPQAPDGDGVLRDAGIPATKLGSLFNPTLGSNIDGRHGDCIPFLLMVTYHKSDRLEVYQRDEECGPLVTPALSEFQSCPALGATLLQAALMRHSYHGQSTY